MDKFTVRDSNGFVDIQASVAAYSAALTEWITNNETDQQVISNAVESVLNAYPNQCVPMRALISKAVMQISDNPTQFNMLSNKVHNYIKGRVLAGCLNVNKGRDGGVLRV